MPDIDVPEMVESYAEVEMARTSGDGVEQRLDDAPPPLADGPAYVLDVETELLEGFVEKAVSRYDIFTTPSTTLGDMPLQCFQVLGIARRNVLIKTWPGTRSELRAK